MTDRWRNSSGLPTGQFRIRNNDFIPGVQCLGVLLGNSMTPRFITPRASGAGPFERTNPAHAHPLRDNWGLRMGVGGVTGNLVMGPPGVILTGGYAIGHLRLRCTSDCHGIESMQFTSLQAGSTGPSWSSQQLIHSVAVDGTGNYVWASARNNANSKVRRHRVHATENYFDVGAFVDYIIVHAASNTANHPGLWFSSFGGSDETAGLTGTVNVDAATMSTTPDKLMQSLYMAGASTGVEWTFISYALYACDPLTAVLSEIDLAQFVDLGEVIEPAPSVAWFDMDAPPSILYNPFRSPIIGATSGSPVIRGV